MATLPPRPNFLIVGMRHCATRWLRFNLDRHPDICAPPVTPEFFTDRERMSRHGLRWYRELFEDWSGERFLGEASPSYADWNNNPREIALRIQRQLPDVRLVAVIGHPVDRFHAELRRLIRWGEVPPTTDPEGFYRLSDQQAVGLRTISSGIQSSGLHAYLNHFEDQLKIVVLEDLLADPAAVYAEVVAHIGADPSFVPPDLAAPRFASDEAVLDVPPPTEATRQQLYEWYRPDVRRLESMLERDFSHWDPGSNLVTYSPEDLFRYVFGDPDAEDVTSN